MQGSYAVLSLFVMSAKVLHFDENRGTSYIFVPEIFSYTLFYSFLGICFGFVKETIVIQQ